MIRKIKRLIRRASHRHLWKDRAFRSVWYLYLFAKFDRKFGAETARRARKGFPVSLRYPS